MRPNNRQRSRGGRNGGGGGGGGGNTHHHKPQHHNNPNRPPNRNQIFDSSGPDVRVRGNAHQVFDKYQSLAREAATSGDRILAEAYWQYADHYFRVIQTMGGFVRAKSGLGRRRRGRSAAGPAAGQQGAAARRQPQQNGSAAQSNDGGDNQSGEQGLRTARRPTQRQSDNRQADNRQSDDRQSDNRQSEGRQSEGRQPERSPIRAVASPRVANPRVAKPERQAERSPARAIVDLSDRQAEHGRRASPASTAWLSSRTAAVRRASSDPAADEQPEVPEFVPASSGRRG